MIQARVGGREAPPRGRGGVAPSAVAALPVVAADTIKFK